MLGKGSVTQLAQHLDLTQNDDASLFATLALGTRSRDEG